MRILFLFIIISLASGQLIGQTTDEANVSNLIENYQILKQQLNYKMEYFIKKSTNNWVLNATSVKENTSLFSHTSTIPSAYSYNDLAIFCKLEVQLEQKTKIPIKFRLGEFNHIEKLEGKPYSPFLVR
ncbi:MAG: hypothetical protein ACPG19_09310 [Saprospiraceae bacterium]